MPTHFRQPVERMVLLAMLFLGSAPLHGAKPDFSGHWVLLEGQRDEAAEQLEIDISATVVKGMNVAVLRVGCVPSSATYPRCGDREFLASGFVSGGGASTGRELFWFGEQLVYTVWAGDGSRRKGYGELWTLEADGSLTIRVTPREGASFSLVYAKRHRP